MRVRDEPRSERGEGQTSKAGERRPVLFAALVLAVAFVSLIRWAALREPGITYREAPEETRGMWTTSDPRYVGRAIEVTAGTVTLRLGEQGAVPGRLRLARELVDDDERVLKLEYETSLGPDAIEMVLGPNRTMTLRNQPEIVWTAGKGPPPVAPATPGELIAEAEPPLPTDSGVPLTLLLIALTGGTGILILGVLGRNREDGPNVPSIVRGVWTTPDPRLDGRTIRIGSGYGFAQFGPGPIRVGGEIAGVQQRREDGARVVTLQYRVGDGLEDVEMVIDQAGHMRLRNGPASVWVKSADR